MAYRGRECGVVSAGAAGSVVRAGHVRHIAHNLFAEVLIEAGWLPCASSETYPYPPIIDRFSWVETGMFRRTHCRFEQVE